MNRRMRARMSGGVGGGGAIPPSTRSTGMKEEMKELYTEGVASHGGPEPCGAAREGDAEALARGTCRRGY